MNTQSYFTYNTKLGKLTLVQCNKKLCGLYFGKRDIQGAQQKTTLLDETAKQLDEYATGSRTTFDLPILLHGTEFQKQVWNALLQIPYGSTVSYKQIAQNIGNPKACRAVGLANNKNPISIVVPCHRVVGTNGSLTGYAGGLELKKKLLELEQQNSKR